MPRSLVLQFAFLLTLIIFVTGQQECYFGPGAPNRGPANLVPCNGTGTSACCLLGDTCLSGNTCYNYATGDLYQYGCTDIEYKDPSCPYKCGFDPTLSPWTALEYCTDIQDLADTWVCHAPESCGCEWNATYDLLVLQPIQCKEMGSNARVAIYAPSTLAPYVSLPSTIGGSTGYYSPLVISGTSTWMSTAVAGYTPSPFTQLTTYRSPPTTTVLIEAEATPAPSTYSAAKSYTPVPSTLQSSKSGNPAASSITTSSNIPSSSINTTAPNNSSQPARSSHLSTGAKAGVGVGAAVGGILLFALLARFFVLAQKRNRERHSLQPEQPQNQYSQSPPMGHYSQDLGPTRGSWVPYPMGTDTGSHYGVPAAGMGGMHVNEMRKPGFSPPASPPAELPVNDEEIVHEIGVSPPTPSPGFIPPKRH